MPLTLDGPDVFSRLASTRDKSLLVIPAKAGIQLFNKFEGELDSSMTAPLLRAAGMMAAKGRRDGRRRAGMHPTSERIRMRQITARLRHNHGRRNEP